MAAGGQFHQYNIMWLKLKITQTLAHGCLSNSTQQELLYEYQHDSVLYGFRNFNIFMPLAKVASASQGLTLILLTTTIVLVYSSAHYKVSRQDKG